MVKVTKIQKIILGAFFIRLLVLSFIFTVTPDWFTGFLSNSVMQDDVRYEMGAIRYAETANSIFDYDAFSSAYALYGDYVGKVKSVFSATPLWYWIVCIIYYIFRTTIVIRVLNIVLSTLSVWLLYRLIKLKYDENMAQTGAKLLAFLPYPVIFSCFSYKDHLIMALTIYLLLQAMCCRVVGAVAIQRIVQMSFSALALLLLRGGLSAILIAICFVLAFFTAPKLNYNKTMRQLLLKIVALIVVTFILSQSMYPIVLKIQAYITGKDISALNGISFVTVTSIKDLYKLPFTFLFAVVMPIGFDGPVRSWFDVVSLLNVCMAPIAVGAAIDIFLHKRNEWLFINSCVIYYFISIIASIGIFRHYFSLLFIPLMLFSHLICYGRSHTKNLWIISSCAYVLVLSMYLAYKIA